MKILWANTGPGVSLGVGLDLYADVEKLSTEAHDGEVGLFQVRRELSITFVFSLSSFKPCDQN